MQVDGVNLQQIPAKDMCTYGWNLLDSLFTKEEQAGSVVIRTKKSSKPHWTLEEFRNYTMHLLWSMTLFTGRLWREKIPKLWPQGAHVHPWPEVQRCLWYWSSQAKRNPNVAKAAKTIVVKADAKKNIRGRAQQSRQRIVMKTDKTEFAHMIMSACMILIYLALHKIHACIG